MSGAGSWNLSRLAYRLGTWLAAAASAEDRESRSNNDCTGPLQLVQIQARGRLRRSRVVGSQHLPFAMHRACCRPAGSRWALRWPSRRYRLVIVRVGDPKSASARASPLMGRGCLSPQSWTRRPDAARLGSRALAWAWVHLSSHKT